MAGVNVRPLKRAVRHRETTDCCGTLAGYKLANDGHDTRAIQHYLGHRNITHTTRYTELASDRFNGFWKD